MKRLWIMVLALVFVIGMTTSGYTAQIKDVDPSHWAYQNVKMLVDKGYFSLYEDSTFRGDKTVTRYQLAEIVARILSNVGSGNVSVADGDVATIRELAVELRKELVDIVQNQSLFDEQLTQLSKNQIVLKEDIARSQQQILEIIDQLVRLNDLEQRLQYATTERDQLKQQIAELEKTMQEDLMQGIEDLNTELRAQLNTSISELKTTTQSNIEAIAQLQEENAQLKAEIEDLKVKNSRVIYYIIGGVLLSVIVSNAR